MVPAKQKTTVKMRSRDRGTLGDNLELEGRGVMWLLDGLWFPNRGMYTMHGLTDRIEGFPTTPIHRAAVRLSEGLGNLHGKLQTLPIQIAFMTSLCDAATVSPTPIVCPRLAF